MADDRDDKKFSDSEGRGKEQATGGQKSHESEYGEQGPAGQAQPGAGSAPPRSMGTHGSEFGQFGDATGPAGQQGQSGTGQADLGSQADTTLAGRSDQQDFGLDQPGRVGGAGSGEFTGEGFIGAQGAGSDDYLPEDESPASAEATGGSDFAPQGRGATEDEDEDEDSGTGPRDVGSGGPGSSV